MTQEIRDFVTGASDLLAFGEPTHQEPAFGEVRNELFAQLVGHGFRSIALETDRVAALAVNDYVQGGTGTLDSVLSNGFSHGFGTLAPNRELVAWLREYNEGRPEETRLSFHGFDASTEMMSAPSPLPYLEHVRDYLGLDLDLANLAGDERRWSRTEAIMDFAESIGAAEAAGKLRVIADDLLVELHARAPELIAATSRGEWFRAQTHAAAGLGLLRYHRECARENEQGTRIFRLSSVRDALMAQNLLDIRLAEARRGPTFVFAQNSHLQRNSSNWRIPETGYELDWWSAGAILASLTGERYTFIAGSLGRSEALGLAEPPPDTFEGRLQHEVPTWGLVRANLVAAGRVRTDPKPEQGYFPLIQATLGGADAVLHINSGAAVELSRA